MVIVNPSMMRIKFHHLSGYDTNDSILYTDHIHAWKQGGRKGKEGETDRQTDRQTDREYVAVDVWYIPSGKVQVLEISNCICPVLYRRHLQQERWNSG